MICAEQQRVAGAARAASAAGAAGAAMAVGAAVLAAGPCWGSKGCRRSVSFTAAGRARAAGVVQAGVLEEHAVGLSAFIAYACAGA